MNESPSTPGPQALGDAAIAFLRRFPPFDEMESDALALIGPRLRVGYFPKQASILTPEDGEPSYFYIVQRGLVHVALPDAYSGQAGTVVSLRAGECFSVGALLEHRRVSSSYVAGADTFCYQLARADFEALLERSARFRQFCTRYLGSLLQQSRRLLGMYFANAASEQQAMGRSLRSLVKRTPVACAPDTPLGDALREMQRETVGSMLIEDAEGRLIGIFTQRDVLDRVALERRDLSEPISAVMTAQPQALSPDHTAYDAALLVAQHGFRHVPIVEAGRAIGVVTERDLFALHRSSLRAVHGAIARARTIDELAAVAGDVRRVARNLLAHGTSPQQLTHLVSTLNDALTRQVIELTRAAHELGDVRWCWLAFGSEGRFEQTIATDQDNGLIFGDMPDAPAGSVRQRLLPFARAVNAALDACGFPLCKGAIMAGNPRWCLSRSEWETQFAGWIENTDPQALLGAAIFFDFRALHGESALVDSLRAALLRMTARTPRFLRQLSEQAVNSRPPLGLFGDFATEDIEHAPHTLDLKAGARLFVDAARVLGLASGTGQTNTAQRLRDAGRVLKMSHDEVGSAVDGFFFIQALRLRGQLASQSIAGSPDPNRLDPDQLNEVDRRILKESFRQARKLQSRLALDYGL